MEKPIDFNLEMVLAEIVLTFCGKSPPQEIYLKTWNSEKKTENKSKAKGLINYIDFPFRPVGAVIEQHPVEKNEIKMWKKRIALNGFIFLCLENGKKIEALNLHRKHEKCAFFCEEN